MRNEKKRNLKKQRRVRNNEATTESEYDYSELEYPVSSNRRDYETSLLRRPWGRYYSEYIYNASGDWNSGWKDMYRPDYSRDHYSTYDSLYDTDEDETSGYQSRGRHYDDYYSDSEYSSYYDEDDTDYTVERSHSAHAGRRQGSLFDDLKYHDRYPEHRHNHSHRHGKKATNLREPSRVRHRNDTSLYATHDILGKKGFNYKKYNTTGLQISEALRDTGIDSGYRGGQVKRKRRPGYNIYTTQTTNNGTPFDKRFKSLSPKRLSVTDYNKIPVLAFRKNNKKSTSFSDESALVYLPLVTEQRDKKHTLKNNFKKHTRLRNLSQRAEKPLENNIAVYRAMDSEKYNVFQKRAMDSEKHNVFQKRAMDSEKHNVFQNKKEPGKELYPFKINDTTAYPASRISQVFRKSATSMNNVNKVPSDSNMKASITRQNPGTGSSTDYTTNKVTSNETVNRSGVGRHSIIQQIEPINEGIHRRSVKPSIGETRNKSVARKEPVTSRTNLDTDFEGLNLQKDVTRQSYVPPRDPSFERGSSIIGHNNPNTPLKGIIKPSIAVTQDKGEVKNPEEIFSRESFVMHSNVVPKRQNSKEKRKSSVPRQSYINTMPKSILQESIKRDLAGPDGASRGQSIVGGDKMTNMDEQTNQKRMARHSIVPQKSHSFDSTDQTNSAGEQRNKKSVVRKSSVVGRGQSFVDKDHVLSSALQNTQEDTARHSKAVPSGQSFVGRSSSVPQKRHSVVSRGPSVVGRGPSVVGRSPSVMGRSPSVVGRGPSVVGRDQPKEAEGQTPGESRVRKSSVARRSQSVADGDLVAGIKESNIKKSMAGQSNITRQSNVAQKGQSVVGRNQFTDIGEKGSQRSLSERARSYAVTKQQSLANKGRSTRTGEPVKKSGARQSNVVGTSQSFVVGDQNLEAGGQDIQKSTARHSSVAQRGQMYESGKRMSTVEQQKLKGEESRLSRIQPQVSNARLSTTSKRGSQRSSVVRRQSVARDDGHANPPQSNIKSDVHENILKQPQQSSKAKQPSETKSKTLSSLKRAFHKIGAFSKKHEQPERDQVSEHRTSTAPMLDVIMSRREMQPDFEPHPIMEESSVESIKQEPIPKSKVSTKSRFSKPFRSLLRRSKKHESRVSNIDDVTSKQQYAKTSRYPSEQHLELGLPYSSEGVGLHDSTDMDVISTESSKPTFNSQEYLPLMVNGYDVTNVLYLFHIAQFIVGVTIHDKLMEVFAVI